MPASSFHRRTASRGIALTAFSVVLFLTCAAYPVIWLFMASNPEPSVSQGFALIVTVMISCVATILGAYGYAAALRFTLRIAYPVRWRLYTLSAALGIASPFAAFGLAWSARHLPIAHLSDTNTVFFLLVCSLAVPYLLGTTVLRLALRKAWLHPPNTPGVCNHCRYNLTGNTSGICPECGRPIPGGPSSRPSIATWPPRPRTSRR